VTISPLLFESITLLMIGLSGIGVGLLLHLRDPLLLAGLAVLVATGIRVVTGLGAWTLSLHGQATEIWWVTSGLVALVGALVALIGHRREYLQSLTIFAALAGVSVSLKYALGVGERHHSDSSKILEIALFIIQPGRDPQLWELEEKRGLAYPLMLALGPEDRIFSSLTPLIFFSVIILSWWLAKICLKGNVPRAFQWASGLVVLGFSLTVPIFRVALNYLNSHTLLALALLVMVAALIVAEKEGTFTPATGSMLFLGSIVGATARVEGIIFVALVLASVASHTVVNGAKARLALFASISASGLSLSWWFYTVGSDVPRQFGLSTWLVALVAVVVGAVVVLPQVDPMRWIFFPLAVGVVGAVLIQVALSANTPLAPFMSQFNNVVRGYGGWGVAALALMASLVLLGWKSRSNTYRRLATVFIVLIISTLVAKLFDGGGFGGTSFGRDGFYDSVNRMWLHSLGIGLTTMIVGYAEFLHEFALVGNRKRPKLASEGAHTLRKASLSKDSPS
jgi:hypothetical protein